MTFEQLTTLMLAGDMTRCMGIFEQHCIIKNIYEAVKQYHTSLHDVNKKEKRQDKMIYSEEDGPAGTTKKVLSKVIPVARLALPTQKRIVLIASAFLGSPCMESNPTPGKQEDLQTVLNKIWDANKLDYKFRTISKKTMSERHAAELWYTNDVDQSYWDGYPIESNLELSMRVLANSLGDELYPVWDEYGDLMAFGRGYRVAYVEDGTDDVQYIHHFDLYTENEIYLSKKEDNVWLFAGVAAADELAGKPSLNFTPEVVSIKNLIGKIPVIYYSQPLTEWEEVQPLIERLETLISNHADTNDYFASPIIAVTGDIQGFAEKGEQGKLLELKNGGDVKYITWDNAPESTKMEMENLQKFINTYTCTVDTSFEQMKALGTNRSLSGFAIQMMFTDAYLKAEDKEEIFGEGVQRRINYLKKAIAVLDESFKEALPLSVKPKFDYFSPKNTQELVTTLIAASGAGIMSNETAVRLNPLVTDPDSELDKIEEEDQKAQAVALKNAPPVVPGVPIPKMEAVK